MRSLSIPWDTLRRSFWFLPAVAIVVAVGLGLGLPELDRSLGLELGTLAFSFSDVDSARSTLETIATVTVSVAGFAFSATVVALTLASQQLSPRVLRTFQANRLSQTTLAVFVGAFVYCLVLLSSLGAGEVPRLSVAFAIVLAVAAFVLFVFFIDDIVNSLQASTLIRRIAADGQHAIAYRYPTGTGNEADDPEAAAERARRRTESSSSTAVRASRAGFLVSVAGEDVVAAAEAHDALVVQRVPIGDFAVTGSTLAEVWCDGQADDGLVDDVREAFRLEGERTIVQDVAFPIRQLADVALRGLSPSLNDPTTAENAMNSLADTLVGFLRVPAADAVRVDPQGAPRFVAARPTLDDLVRLGFEQVRVKAATYPIVSVRLLALLAELQREADEARVECPEIGHQAALIAESPDVPTASDEERVRAAHRGRHEADPPASRSARRG